MDPTRPPSVSKVTGNGHVTAPAPADGIASTPTLARRRRWWLAVVVLSIVAAVVGAAIAPRISGWLTGRAPPGLLFASGRIEGRMTTLTPTSSATVVGLHADEGDAVRSGQVLATLDDPAQRQRIRSAEEQLSVLTERLRAADTHLRTTTRQVALQMEQAAATLREVEARLARAQENHLQAQRDAERAAVLAGRDLISPQAAEHARLRADVEAHGVREAEAALLGSQKQLALAQLGREQLDTLRAQRDALEGERRGADAQLAEQRSRVIDFSIRSPVAGTVLTRTVELGERVTEGTPLFTLVDLDRLYVKIYVPEPRIGQVALGQEARVYVDAYPDRTFAARVSKVAQEAEFTPKNVETREERVKLVFAVEIALAENPDGVLKPGMPADAVIRWQRDAPWVSPAATGGGTSGGRDRRVIR